MIKSNISKKELQSELLILQSYRELFKTIAKSDPKLEYSGEELLEYYNQIESSHIGDDYKYCMCGKCGYKEALVDTTIVVQDKIPKYHYYCPNYDNCNYVYANEVFGYVPLDDDSTIHRDE